MQCSLFLKEFADGELITVSGSWFQSQTKWFAECAFLDSFSYKSKNENNIYYLYYSFIYFVSLSTTPVIHLRNSDRDNTKHKLVLSNVCLLTTPNLASAILEVVAQTIVYKVDCERVRQRQLDWIFCKPTHMSAFSNHSYCINAISRGDVSLLIIIITSL